MTPARAWVALGSGRRLDLLNPSPHDFEDRDLAVGLSRTYRWGGHSRWEHPLTVAQHSLTVLAIRQAHAALSGTPLTPGQALRELLHDAEEALAGPFDPVAPLKPHLGEGYARLVERLHEAVAERYALPPWSPEERALHKRADRLAAASEALHVAGWGRGEIKGCLGIALEPLETDPLQDPSAAETGHLPWEPWPSHLACERLLQELTTLAAAHRRDTTLCALQQAFLRLPARARARLGHIPDGNGPSDALVLVDAADGSATFEGIVVDGERDESGAWLLGDTEFTILTTDGSPDGELIHVRGWNCSTERL